MKRILLLIALFIGISVAVSAQTESFDALKADYPQLMKKFGKELEGQLADYIFAIDVSGTMNKYKDTVVPALGEFFRSLQEGDYVSIIKFSGEATNEVGSAGKISAETITNLINYAGHVYDTPTTDFEKEKYFKWTDLDNMLHYLANDMKQIDRRPTFSQEHIDQMRSECNLMATHFPYVFEVYDGGHSIFCHMEDK